MSKLLSDQISQKIAIMDIDGHLERISESLVMELIRDLDPKAIFALQPALFQEIGDQCLVTFSDGSSFACRWQQPPVSFPSGTAA